MHIQADSGVQSCGNQVRVSQSKLYGNEFQACKIWQHSWLLTAQRVEPALKVIICPGFVTKDDWQTKQGSWAEDY